MSEYQYYEFVAIDQPLTAAQQDELRAVSTRGRISSSSFVNDYQWGDLKADPRDWMERYFDAFLYLASWGTHRIALRLPIGVLSHSIAAAYCVGDSAHAWATRTHVVIDVYSQDEGGDEWREQEGTLASIASARAELAAGDHRLLYLAWLLCVQNRELDDDEPEPPVPPSLASLSGPLRAFADFLRLDTDLLAVAAQASTPLIRKAPSGQAMAKWVKAMSAAEKDELVLRLLRRRARNLTWAAERPGTMMPMDCQAGPGSGPTSVDIAPIALHDLDQRGLYRVLDGLAAADEVGIAIVFAPDLDGDAVPGREQIRLSDPVIYRQPTQVGMLLDG